MSDKGYFMRFTFLNTEPWLKAYGSTLDDAPSFRGMRAMVLDEIREFEATLLSFRKTPALAPEIAELENELARARIISNLMQIRVDALVARQDA